MNNNTKVPRRYNGHPSYNHWNVALWLYNDEYLYRKVRQVAHTTPTKEKGAETLLEEFQSLGITHTPDGVRYTKELVKYAIEEEYDV